MPASTWDTIVVGGGISGLSAALQVARSGHRVLVLESRSRLGGRIHTIQSADHGGEPIDLGASFVHGVNGNPLATLSAKAGYTLHLPPTTASSAVFESDGRRWDAKNADRFTYLSHTTTFKRLHAIAQEGQAPLPSTSVGAALKEAPACQPPWQGIEAEERARLLAVGDMWNGWTGAELDKVSLRWWGFEREFLGEDALVKEGYGTLIDWNAGQLRELGVTVMLDSKVVRFESKDDTDTVSVTVSGGPHGAQDHHGRIVICSLPLGVLQHPEDVVFLPPLPQRKVAALSRLGFGLLNKVVLSYDTAWWRDGDDTLGESDGWITVLSPAKAALSHPESDSLEMFRSSSLFLQDYTHITGAPVLLVFFGPPRAEALEDLQEDAVALLLHERLLAALTPAATASRSHQTISPPHCTITRWRADHHSRGSYSYIPAARSPTREGDEVPSPLDMIEAARPVWGGRLRFCGEHTHEHCYASVHGALLSGDREGAEVNTLLESSS